MHTRPLTALLPLVALAPFAAAQDAAPTPPATPAAAPPAAPAQPAAPAVTLKAGDRAPALSVEKFLKGDAITGFEAGRTYVVEFWATWCGPCIAAMPHLSELQAGRKNLTVIGVNIWEDPKYSDKTEPKARAFVEKQGDKMAYTVAYDGAAKAADAAWMQAAGRKGIPTTFVVDAKGIIAWIGHPSSLDYVLDELAAGRWDPVEGPKTMAAARAALDAACGKYAEGLEAGDRAFAEYARTYPGLTADCDDRRYTAMLRAGHDEQAYKLGRRLFERAKAAKNSPKLMGVVVPMMDPQNLPKTIDRQLALDVAEAVYELGDPADPGRHICMVQIHLLLGNFDEARKHRAKAEELIPAESKAALIRWLDQLEADAAKKK